jgi:hypothetical protein
LRVTKRPARDDVVFDFILDYKESRAEGQRHVERRRYDQLLPALQALNDHVGQFREPTPTQSGGDTTRIYRDRVTDWLGSLGELILHEFLPPDDTDFAKLMRDVEGGAESLLVLSNDFCTPWWLTNSYSQVDEAWVSLLGCAFSP